MKKHITILLLVGMLLSTLTSCGTETTVAETSPQEETVAIETAEPLPPEKTLDIPDKDWGDKEFLVLGQTTDRPQWTNFEIDADGLTGEVVNDAVYNRNLTLESKYGVVISQDISPVNSGDHLVTTVTAGEDLYDLAFVDSNKIGKLAREKMLYDMNTVEYIDFSKDWWNPLANESLSIDGKLFFTTSDFSLRDKNRVYIMVYNKDMVADNGLDNPVELVRDGQWTLDTVAEMLTAVSVDMDGDGAISEMDQFGLTCDSGNALATMVIAAGNTMVTKDANDIPVVAPMDHMVDSLDRIMTFWAEKRYVVLCEEWNGKVDYDYWSVCSRFFHEGRALLSTVFPASLAGMSENCVNDYGVVPFPKYDEAQDIYYTAGDWSSQVFCIPVTTTETDFTGFMLEALSAASTDTTLNAYYEITCKQKYVYDPESAEMLDLIFDGVRYDHATIFEIKGLNGLTLNFAQQRKHNYASRYASIKEQAETSIAELIADIQ